MMKKSHCNVSFTGVKVLSPLFSVASLVHSIVPGIA